MQDASSFSVYEQLHARHAQRSMMQAIPGENARFCLLFSGAWVCGRKEAIERYTNELRFSVGHKVTSRTHWGTDLDQLLEDISGEVFLAYISTMEDADSEDGLSALEGAVALRRKLAETYPRSHVHLLFFGLFQSNRVIEGTRLRERLSEWQNEGDIERIFHSSALYGEEKRTLRTLAFALNFYPIASRLHCEVFSEKDAENMQRKGSGYRYSVIDLQTMDGNYAGDLYDAREKLQEKYNGKNSAENRPLTENPLSYKLKQLILHKLFKNETIGSAEELPGVCLEELKKKSELLPILWPQERPYTERRKWFGANERRIIERSPDTAISRYYGSMDGKSALDFFFAENVEEAAETATDEAAEGLIRELLKESPNLDTASSFLQGLSALRVEQLNPVKLLEGKAPDAVPPDLNQIDREIHRALSKNYAERYLYRKMQKYLEFGFHRWLEALRGIWEENGETLFHVYAGSLSREIQELQTAYAREICAPAQFNEKITLAKFEENAHNQAQNLSLANDMVFKSREVLLCAELQGFEGKHSDCPPVQHGAIQKGWVFYFTCCNHYDANAISLYARNDEERTEG